MSSVIYAMLVLGIMGGGFGLILGFAAKAFAVEVDERQQAISEILPGANCGGCGYAGCSAYAAAIVSSGAPTNACAAGGPEVASRISEIMGVKSGKMERYVALVQCSGFEGHAAKKFEYVGIHDCVAAMRLGGGLGPNECPNGCMGMGTCVNACPFGAMYLEDGIAHVDREKCVGCMVCANACPKGIIVKVPYDADVTIACASKDKGAAVRKYCDIGCIGCKICERTCQYDAVHVLDNLARIDYSKCTNCGECALKCPRKLIRDGRLLMNSEAV